MFCTRCGKQIDDNSVFCTFCGQQVNASVIESKPTMNPKSTVIARNVAPIKKGISNQAKKWIIGAVAGLAVVTGVTVGVVSVFSHSDDRKFTQREEKTQKTSEKISKNDIMENENVPADEEADIKRQELTNTSADEVTDTEILDVLIAYQKYVERLSDEMGNETVYTMVYINDDDIPECLAWSSPYKSFDNTTIYGYMELRVLSYIKGSVQMSEFAGYSGCETYFGYTPKQGQFLVDEELGLRGAAQYTLVELNSSGFNKIDEAWNDCEGAGEFYYFDINGMDVSADEFNNWLNSFDFEQYLGGGYDSILTAYDVLRTNV